jgi:DNA-binding FrmR family transcriptional regulator
MSECNCNRTTHRSEDEVKALSNRCSRIEGQIRGIKGMLEKDVYCDDILNQIAAAQSALNALSRVILERHIKTCVIDRIQDGEPEVVDEFMLTLEKLMKRG